MSQFFHNISFSGIDWGNMHCLFYSMKSIAYWLIPSNYWQRLDIIIDWIIGHSYSKSIIKKETCECKIYYLMFAESSVQQCWSLVEVGQDWTVSLTFTKHWTPLGTPNLSSVPLGDEWRCDYTFSVTKPRTGWGTGGKTRKVHLLTFRLSFRGHLVGLWGWNFDGFACTTTERS